MVDEEKKITLMWQQFIQENDRPNLSYFQNMVAAELKCSIVEAKELTAHLLLTE